MTHKRSFKTLRRKYTFERTLKTNISIDYLDDSGSRWGIYQMFRETMQNLVDEAEYMMDTNGGNIWDYYKVYTQTHSNSRWGDKIHIFRDFGRGVDLEKIFLIGESGKRGSHYRGEKGEGEALSFLVATRCGLKKTMFSQDWAVESSFEAYNGNDEYQVLVFHVYRTNKPIEGTVWKYETEQTLAQFIDDRNEYFPDISAGGIRSQEANARQRSNESEKEYKRRAREHKAQQRRRGISSSKSIFIPKEDKPARLYVKGIYVKDIDCMFSYNLQDVSINRDRSMVDDFDMLQGIKAAFQSNEFTMKMATIYWRCAMSKFYSQFEFIKAYEFGGNADIMKKAFYKVFGKKAVIATETFMQTEAIALGFDPIDLDAVLGEVAQDVGVKTDQETSGFLNGYKEVNPTKSEQSKLKQLHEIGLALELPLDNADVVIASKIAGVDDTVLGICTNDPNTLYGQRIVLMRKAFKNSRKLVETYIHEFMHVKTAAGDGTREFTSGFESLIMNLLTEHKMKAIELVTTFIANN